MPLAELTGFFGANLKTHERFLPPGYCVSSVNQKPNESGDLRPWRNPLTISGPVVPANRQTIYRMGRDSPTPSDFWLSWSTIVHAIRGFDATDATERTYFTGFGTPKWTDNIMALAGTPYPAGTRELKVPQPILGATITLETDGPAGGTAAVRGYVYTWVSDIGWESAPSPPTNGPLCLPGAVLDLLALDTVPSGNYGVNRIRWYRTQDEGDSAEYFFLREFAINAVGQQDDGRDVDTTDGPLQPNGLWLALDDSATWLTECWNQFASALVGKTVRFCEPEIIYAWPLEYEYILFDTPRAQCAFGQRLFVLTSAGAEVFTGTDPAAMDQKRIKVAPIVSQRSLAVGEDFCMWAAADGLWYYGVDGYRCLTNPGPADQGSLTAKQWDALNPSSIAGYLFQEGARTMYVGFYNDGALKGFVVDPSNPNGIYFLDKGYTTGYWDRLLRKLYVLDGSTLKQWDGDSTFMTATVQSKKFRQMEETEGEWLETLGTGSANVRLLVDDLEVFNHTVVSAELQRLYDGTQGRDWQLEASTDSAFQGCTVD